VSEVPKDGRLAGIDFGTVRIGIAITDPGQVLASPYENYNRRTPEKDAAYFRQLAEQEKVVTFVVGLPVHMSGDSSRMSEAAVEFGEWLQETTGVPVIWFDERYTSSLAKERLRAGNLTAKKKKKRLDMLAAQVLLASFLESDRTGHDHKDSPDAI
jgi:putative Holliday junction resolvase